MASSITTTITTRLANKDAEAIRAQAARFGLRPSQAVAALIESAVDYERQRQARPSGSDEPD